MYFIAFGLRLIKISQRIEAVWWAWHLLGDYVSNCSVLSFSLCRKIKNLSLVVPPDIFLVVEFVVRFIPVLLQTISGRRTAHGSEDDLAKGSW